MSWYEDERKKKNEEILSLGKGPIKEVPDKNIYAKEPATFTNEKFKSLAEPYIQPAIKKEETEVNPTFKWNRGEEGYRNREFTYDVYKDPLYLQYLASAKRNGQAAMTDTIAKVAAQTGGIAGSYAVAAGAGSYNDYMQSANDIIPELEQIAYARYQDELARDLKIHEMDEAERWERAEVDSIIQDHQASGAPLTTEKRAKLYAAGYYMDRDGNIVAPEGNKYSPGDSYLTQAKDAYEQYGFWGMPAEYRDELYKNGFKYDDAAGMMVDANGVHYAYAGKTPIDDALLEWMLGGDVTPYLAQLENAGYTYDALSNRLYDPEGNYVKTRQDAEEDAKLIAIEGMISRKESLGTEAQDLLADRGFFNDNGTWTHVETGKTLAETLYGEESRKGNGVLDFENEEDGESKEMTGERELRIGDFNKTHFIAPQSSGNASKENSGEKVSTEKNDKGDEEKPVSPEGEKERINPVTGEDYATHGAAETAIALIIAGRYDYAEKVLEDAVREEQMTEKEAKQVLKDYYHIIYGGE